MSPSASGGPGGLQSAGEKNAVSQGRSWAAAGKDDGCSAPPPDHPFAVPKRKRARKGSVLPPPGRSARLYFHIAPDTVHLFRYYLEAEDNLGLMTVVDRWRAALMLRYSPHQEKEIRLFIERVRPMLDLEGPLPIP